MGKLEFVPFQKNCDVNLRSEGVLNVDDDADHLVHVEFLLDQQLLFFATKFGSLGTYDCINGQVRDLYFVAIIPRKRLKFTD